MKWRRRSDQAWHFCILSWSHNVQIFFFGNFYNALGMSSQQSKNKDAKSEVFFKIKEKCDQFKLHLEAVTTLKGLNEQLKEV